MRRLTRALRNQRGYTIVELVVAMTIFSVVVIVAVGGFVAVQRTSQKTAAQRKVQQDSRTNLEQLARQVRAGQINYGFYAKSVNTNDIRCNLAGRRMLAMYVADATSSAPKQVFYFYDAGTKRLYSLTSADLTTNPDCANVVGSADKVDQLAEDVSLSDLQFFVLPTRNPLDPAQSDIVKNTHPRVTVLWTAQTGANSSSGNASYNQDRLQMTISTRSYPINQTVGQ